MAKTLKMLARASTLALAAAAATPAFAQDASVNNSNAGDEITNTVSVTYKVENIDQEAIEASDMFVVDRKINLTVTAEGTATTQVTPGATQQVTTFLVQNLTNDATMDISLAVTEVSGFDLVDANIKIFWDDDDDGLFEPAEDSEVTYLDEMPEDEIHRVFVVADIPSGLATGAESVVRLSGTAREGGVASAQGDTFEATVGENTAADDNVFADDSPSGGDSLQNGITYDEDSYTVLTAAITALKTSKIISDPISGTTDPKMIPGATVEYCVAVTNGGGATATDIEITDNLPTQTTYEPTFGILVDGTTSSGDCLDDGDPGGSHSAGTITAPLADLPASATRTVKFRVILE